MSRESRSLFQFGDREFSRCFNFTWEGITKNVVKRISSYSVGTVFLSGKRFLFSCCCKRFSYSRRYIFVLIF